MSIACNFDTVEILMPTFDQYRYLTQPQHSQKLKNTDFHSYSEIQNTHMVIDRTGKHPGL